MKLFILTALLFFVPSVHAQEWQNLFNGKDLTGFVIDGPKEWKDKSDGDKMKPLWSVDNGIIKATGKAYGFIRYDRKFKDFTIHVEYRLTPSKDVNSGVGIRTVPWVDKTTKEAHESRPSNYAYEVQILDDADAKPTDHTTASLYRYVAASAKNHKPGPEWNAIEIECKGPNIRIEMNGVEVLKVDQSTNPKIKDKPLEGYVCVQSHSGVVEFRAIKIKEWK